MDDIVLISISKQELKDLIQESIKVELDNRTTLFTPPTQEDKLLSMEEVQNILSVSKVTVHKWKRKGLLPYYKLNRRLYFKKSEILNAVKHIKRNF